MQPERHPVGYATPLSRWVAVPAVALFAVLLATSTRYGYHRDELYFIAAGGHPAFGYPDQPPLVPLLSRAAQLIAPGSLTVLRLPSAIALVLTVIVSALISRELGGDHAAQVIAASCTAAAAITVATGHFVTTTTFDVLSTTLLCWLVIRAVATGRGRPLLWAGVVTGVGLEAKPQVGLVAVVIVLALAAVGPRWPLRSGWSLAGALVAVILASPYIIWQTQHGWPQLTVAANVAGTAEGGRIGFIPFQLVLVGPLLTVVWVGALVALARRADWRRWRFLALTYLVLAIGYLAGNGKAYYLATLYPALLGFGAVLVSGWLRRGRRRVRLGAAAAVLALSAAANVVVGLPLLPVSALPGSLPLALNPDLGETVGWPQFVSTVSSVWDRLPPTQRAHGVILAENYGEAGAVDLYGPARSLPAAYSGQNGFGLWGAPPAGTTEELLLGYDPTQAAQDFAGCTVATVIASPDHLANDENGQPVITCGAPRFAWAALWPTLRHLD